MDQRWGGLGRELRKLGMWRHLPAERAAEAEALVAEGGYPLRLSDGAQGVNWFFVDGEEMAEAGVPRELRDLMPALEAHGVAFHVDELAYPAGGVEDGDYVVSINGRRCVVWTAEDWRTDQAWTVAVVRPLAVLNDLLAEARATPRLFTLYAGMNDGVVWLLDPRIVDAVADSGLVEEREIPALAVLG
ncbi:hypothetical protein Aph02nite_55640 [Actinoplanes philippinensis]|nr:hypothetical protein [Actinoplanes philippinensis]GIE79614.1 hypothetical protein Aph02nite_55640 [Actinoplanes philippinensis]